MEAAHDSTALTLAAFSAFALFAGGFWMIASLGQWALAPVERPAAGLRLPTQFSVGEFLLLMLQAQAAVAGGLWWCGGDRDWMLTVAAVLGLGAIAVWWVGIRRMSRCGVTSSLRRAVFLLFVSPTTVAAFIAALWINGRAVVSLLTTGELPWGPWLASNLAVIGAFVLCRVTTLWILSDARPAMPAPIADDGICYVSPIAERE